MGGNETMTGEIYFDPLKCIHLKEIDKVKTKEGIAVPLYKCDKGHKICQESMFSPICKDYEINEEMKQ